MCVIAVIATLSFLSATDCPLSPGCPGSGVISTGTIVLFFTSIWQWWCGVVTAGAIA